MCLCMYVHIHTHMCIFIFTHKSIARWLNIQQQISGMPRVKFMFTKSKAATIYMLELEHLIGNARKPSSLE